MSLILFLSLEMLCCIYEMIAKTIFVYQWTGWWSDRNSPHTGPRSWKTNQGRRKSCMCTIIQSWFQYNSHVIYMHVKVFQYDK